MKDEKQRLPKFEICVTRRGPIGSHHDEVS